MFRFVKDEKEAGMAKRLVVLVALLAVMLATAVPAFAQQQGPVTATGVLVGPVEDNDPDPTPEFRLTDEASGTTYVLGSV